MRAIALLYKINVGNIRNKDKLNRTTKYLIHSTNLTIGTDPSTEVSHLSNNTIPKKTFTSIKNSMSSLNKYLSTVTLKLIDMTGKSENIENKNTTKKPTTKKII